MAKFGVFSALPFIHIRAIPLPILLLFLFAASSTSSGPHLRPSLPHHLRHLHSSLRVHPSEGDLPSGHDPSPQVHPAESQPGDPHLPLHLFNSEEFSAVSAQPPSVIKAPSNYLRSATGRSSPVPPLPSFPLQRPTSFTSDPTTPRPSHALQMEDFHHSPSLKDYGNEIDSRTHRSQGQLTQPAPIFPTDVGNVEPFSPPSELRRLRQASPDEYDGGRSQSQRRAEPQSQRRAQPQSKEFSAAGQDSRESVPIPFPIFESGGGHPTSPPDQLPPPTPPLSSSSAKSSSSTLQPPLVTTDCGDVMGSWVDVSTGGRVASFLGIPYSEPPVGDLRFRAPVPVSPWRRTKDATKFGPMCIQPGNQFVWDAVRFPSPTTPTPQHQTARPKHLRHSTLQRDTKKDERTLQLPEPSILFSALIEDTPASLGLSSGADNDTAMDEAEELTSTTTASVEQEAESQTEATDQTPSAPVMRRRRMRNYEMSEDCLTLNVYTPQLHSNVSSGGLPILFFIHGGSYYMNGGRLYPGEELAARGAVVVTFNYRLGPFGFLSTGEPSCRGNWGLLDQVEALRWVRRNAQVFGGDAHNSLCLVGNSAGAASVLLHMVSPVTKGLFSCAVAMSGCSGAPWALQPRPLRHAKSLATRLGCPHPNRRPHHAVACLRTFSAQLIAENSDLEDGLGVAFAPVVDGVGVSGVGGGRRGPEGSEAGNAPGTGPFIPEDPRRLMAEGKFAQVPFLSGLTRDEVSIWFSNFGPTMEKRLMRVFLDKDIRQLLNGTGLPSLNSVALSHAAAHLYLWGGRGEGGQEDPRVVEAHKPFDGMRGFDAGARGSTLAVADFISDVGLKAPCIYDMELIARSNQKASFFYEFQYHSVDDARTDKQEWIGAYHESELQFLFGEPFLGYSNHLRSANDKEVSEMLMSLWINFAKHGHPTPGRGTEGLHANVDWQPFSTTHRQYLVLTYRPRMAENYLTERMVFWNHIADAFRRHPMPPFCTNPPVTAAPPMVNLPLPPPNHLRWIFWMMVAGNAVFLFTIVVYVYKRLRVRARSPTNRSANAGV